MRGAAAAGALFLALLVSAPHAAASSRPPLVGTSMTVAASSHAAGARRLRLTLTLRYVMQCSYPGAGPLVVTFPSALKLPARFGAHAVRLAGKPAAAKIQGRQVTVTVPPHEGVLCDLLGPGSLTLVFTRAARLANPARKGSYHFTATHLRRAFTATLAIES